MQILHTSQFNNSQTRFSSTKAYGSYTHSQKNTTFKGTAPTVISKKTAETVEYSVKSKFFEPVKKFFKPLTDSFKKDMDKITTGIAHGLGKILNIKTIEKGIDKTKDWDLVSGLTTFTSIVLSGFYIKKTMDNKDLDDHRKKTLAINQGATWALSTVLSFAATKWLDKKIDKFTKNFVKANANEEVHMIDKYKVGIKAASSIMIFGTMYRFVAPVAITPVANYFGNRLEEKKKAERLARANNDNK